MALQCFYFDLVWTSSRIHSSVMSSTVDERPTDRETTMHEPHRVEQPWLPRGTACRILGAALGVLSLSNAFEDTHSSQVKQVQALEVNERCPLVFLFPLSHRVLSDSQLPRTRPLPSDRDHETPDANNLETAPFCRARYPACILALLTHVCLRCQFRDACHAVGAPIPGAERTSGLHGVQGDRGP